MPDPFAWTPAVQLAIGLCTLAGFAAVVPGAVVDVKSTDSGLTSRSVTNSEGYYSIPALLPGYYDVNIRKPGFIPLTQTGLQLVVQQVARLDLVLQLGTVSESIERSDSSASTTSHSPLPHAPLAPVVRNTPPIK